VQLLFYTLKTAHLPRKFDKTKYNEITCRWHHGL
jgi:hypothetical protein